MIETYRFYGKVNRYDFSKMLPLDKYVKEEIGTKINFNITESVLNIHNKGKRDSEVNMDITVEINNEKQSTENNFKKIKSGIEKILGKKGLEN